MEIFDKKKRKKEFFLPLKCDSKLVCAIWLGMLASQITYRGTFGYDEYTYFYMNLARNINILNVIGI